MSKKSFIKNLTEKVFLISYLEAMKLWDFEKNRDVDPRTISVRSHRVVCWKCPEGKDHEWEAPVARITQSLEKHSKTCPICSGTKVVVSTCLATTHPSLASTWHPTKNEKWTPQTITAGSNVKIWWLCPEDSDHEWEASVNNRVKQGCPFCSGRKVSKSNNLEALFPEIAKEWHPTKNGTSLPSKVTAKSNKKAVWACPKGHEYTTKIYHRTASKSGCPFCSGHKLTKESSLEHMRPDLAKEWHPTKNVPLLPSEVHSSSGITVWWRCSKNTAHEWESTIDNRNKGNGCPLCNNGWTRERLRLFVASILPLINFLTEAELYILCLKSGALDITKSARGKSFVKALASGKFPQDELEKFAENEPSLVDDFMNDPSISLENLEEDLDDDKHCLSGSEVEDSGEELPIIQAKEVLASIDHHCFSNFGKDDVEFFIQSAVAKIWQHVFVDEPTGIEQVEHFKETEGLYSALVKATFLSEYNAAKSLQVPEGYNFSVKGTIRPPNLMQLHTADLVKARKRLGNWSGTGSGKTLAAILASRIINARLTIICCPNCVVSGWKEKIKEAYPDSIVRMKDTVLTPCVLSSKPCYLILNYEFFQSVKRRHNLKVLLDHYKIDFIIIDEIHYSKQRHAKISSIRKKIISSFLQKAQISNENLHVLGMSATPVINNLFEGKTLLELVMGRDFEELRTNLTVPNCVILHQKLVSHGIRLMPRYKNTLNIVVENVDCSSFLPEIKLLGAKASLDDMDGLLTRAKIPYILEIIRPKTIVYAHFWNKNGALVELKKAIEEKGWRVTSFTGESKEGLSKFIEGDADILIASSCIGTGIDGLQHVCSRMIVASLPWTHAAFEQLKGRVYRQGQEDANVEIFVPLTYAIVNEQRWSWCENRWERIKFKKTVADASVDGIIPEGHLQSREKALEASMALLNKLS